MQPDCHSVGKSPFSKRLLGWCKELEKLLRKYVFYTSSALFSNQPTEGGPYSRLGSNFMCSLGCINSIITTVLWTKPSFIQPRSSKHAFTRDAQKYLFSNGHVPGILLSTQAGRVASHWPTEGQASDLPLTASGELKRQNWCCGLSTQLETTTQTDVSCSIVVAFCPLWLLWASSPCFVFSEILSVQETGPDTNCAPTYMRAIQTAIPGLGDMTGNTS